MQISFDVDRSRRILKSASKKKFNTILVSVAINELKLNLNAPLTSLFGVQQNNLVVKMHFLN